MANGRRSGKSQDGWDPEKLAQVVKDAATDLRKRERKMEAGAGTGVQFRHTALAEHVLPESSATNAWIGVCGRCVRVGRFPFSMPLSPCLSSFPLHASQEAADAVGVVRSPAPLSHYKVVDSAFKKYSGFMMPKRMLPCATCTFANCLAKMHVIFLREADLWASIAPSLFMVLCAWASNDNNPFLAGTEPSPAIAEDVIALESAL
ncbi:hypothetical protein BCR44DRAFT_92297 [Catenaria anguillulae PL171]|uniref:Uncharacterized protein n=1 Tax=Catenaria anguillulae PL171 TaxID=765915 RepID=A0A1Y2H5N2_9FUNG|nr:hypothetical protein BCR44DRAFT_92297 [Catenaria anguillulae PL171]